MRDNGPITNREVTLAPHDEIVSSSDIHGNILFCNDTFIKISGYTSDELSNQPHNILRHPHMPPSVFGLFWGTLKAGKPWMGIVKNRCKNGDHYWVNAYVTPVHENGRVIGFESVRTKADAACIARAEAVYQRLQAGQPFMSTLATLWQTWSKACFTFTSSFIVLQFMAYAVANISVQLILGSLGVAGLFAALAHWNYSRGLNITLARAHETINDPIAAYIYTGRVDAQGQIELAEIALKARLRTALSRFHEAALELHKKARSAHDQAQKTHHGISAQQQETANVAHAMQQMSQAVQEVASGATKTSTATSMAITEVVSGQQVISVANKAISDLSEMVSSLGQVLAKLSEDSGRIASVVDVIRGIAEQTNLLALNAAIEAARAGEQGRGFAVVADEVRTLAQRTQESTSHIQEIIGNLGNATNDASRNMANCQQLAGRSVEEMANVRTALSSISNSVTSIDQMSHQIAAAAEEQSAMAREIEHNMVNIAQISDQSQQQVNIADQLNREMSELSLKQKELIVRFN